MDLACSIKEENGNMQEKPALCLVLPSPALNHPLLTRKMNLIAERGLHLQYTIPNLKEGDQCSQIVNGVLNTARILQLNESEWYFMEEDDYGPYNPRNEIEALSLIFSVLCRLIESKLGENERVARALMDAVTNLLNSITTEDIFPIAGLLREGSSEAMLLTWATENGVKSKVNLAVFEGCGRGGIAAEDISTGDLVLEIPQHLLLCEKTITKPEMVAAMRELNINGETMALLWSMHEHYDMKSTFAPYFASLPVSFNTGLSFGIAGLKSLEGTIVLEEILQAKEHLHSQYDSLIPILTKDYPQHFPKDIYTWDHFLWACELWYTNGMQVCFPDGATITCLVPIAGLLNHGLYPHITHYSIIDPVSCTLRLHATRPCKAGEQCLLSYGPFSNAHLLTFYGFVLNGDNPYDHIPIDLDLSDAPHLQPVIERYALGFSHMVRGTWLSRSKLSSHGLPSRLLATLRIAFMDDDELKALTTLQRHSVISPENECKVIKFLLSVLNSMLDSIGEPSSLTEDTGMDSWDVRLAARFKGTQRKILQSSCASCSQLLRSLS